MQLVGLCPSQAFKRHPECEQIASPLTGQHREVALLIANVRNLEHNPPLLIIEPELSSVFPQNADMISSLQRGRG